MNLTNILGAQKGKIKKTLLPLKLTAFLELISILLFDKHHSLNIAE